MKIVRVYTGEDMKSHLEVVDRTELDYVERGGLRTAVETATGVKFARRGKGEFTDFHNAPRRQYVLYLIARSEIGVGDCEAQILEPGDVLLAEDTAGRGHTSRVLENGMSVTVRLEG